MVDKQVGNKTAKTSNAAAARLNVKGGAHPVSDNAHNVTRLTVGPDGIVNLPAGVTPDQIHVQGKDLVVNLADGSQIVIVNGAQNVPTIELGATTELPAQNVIALLNIEGQPGVQPAAGPAGSAGGNFSTPPGAIDPGFGISPLLPPTALQFGAVQLPQVFPGVIQQGPPTVTVPASPATPGGAPPPGTVFAPGTEVFEAGLPAHNGLPQGSAYGNGSNATHGTVTYTAPAGLASITFNGQTLTTGLNITTSLGMFTVNSVNLSTGVITYTYTLNTSYALGQTPGDIFHVVVTDQVGQSATGSFTVTVIDDHPTANADIASDGVTNYAAITGNVETAAGDTNTGGADVQGANGAHVSGVSASGASSLTSVPTGTAGVSIAGHYGELTIHQDGSYSYVRNAGTPGGVSDVFNYQLTDGHGNTSSTTLTINIGQATPTVHVTPGSEQPTDQGGNGLVYEAALANGSHSGGSATTSGSISYTPGDSPDTVTIGGVNVAVGATVTGAHGVLTITSVDTVNHTVGYSYTLTSPVTGANANNGANNEGAGDTFAVVVTDTDGSTATASVVVDVIDDVPTAVADTNEVTANSYAVVTGNVEANDTQGADGAAVLGVKAAASASFTAVASGSAGVTIHGLYGDLTIHQDGSYSYARAAGSPGGVSDVFNYQLTDRDGDVSTTTLTVNIDQGFPTVHVTPGPEQPTDDGGNALVFEAALPNGTHSGGSATTVGSISYTPGDGPDTITVGGVTITTVGQTINGTHGVLTITSIDTVNHTVGYSYTLTSPVTNGASIEPDENFAVTVTDQDHTTVNAAIVINAVDDHPVANADTGSVADGATLTVDVAHGLFSASNTGGAGMSAPVRSAPPVLLALNRP